MPEPTLLYASPFPPLRSGISAYSAALVRALAAHFAVTLLTDDYELSDRGLARDFPVLRFGRDRINVARFDHRLYNIGNHPDYHSYVYDCALRWPGTVILHDTVLYYLVVGHYQHRPGFYSKLYQIGGPRAVDIIKQQVKQGRELLHFDRPETLPLNREIVAASPRVLVHSRASYELLAADSATRPKLARVGLVNPPVRAVRIDRDALFARYGVPRDCRVAVSIGFIAPTKQNLETCEAVEAVNRRHGPRLCYVMVGEGTYVDAQLGTHVVKTGYVDEDELDAFIAHADVVVNLRSRSMGEASAALLRALGMGKPCVVPDAAWFAELPDDVVVKVDPSRARDELRRLFDDWLAGSPRWPARVEAAIRHVEREHAPEAVVAELARLLGSGTPAPAMGAALG